MVLTNSSKAPSGWASISEHPFRRKCVQARFANNILCRGHGLAYVTLRVVGDVDSGRPPTLVGRCFLPTVLGCSRSATAIARTRSALCVRDEVSSAKSASRLASGCPSF